MSARSMRALLWALLVLMVSAGTLLVARARDGLVLGADRLHTLPTSPMASATDARRFFLLTPSVVLGNVGEGVEFHHIFSKLKAAIDEYEVDCGEEMPLRAIAHCCKVLVRSRHPQAHLVVAGHQTHPADDLSAQAESAHEPFGVFEILPQGTLLEQDVVAAGSGGPLVASLFDRLYAMAQSSTGSTPPLTKVVSACRDSLTAAAALDPRTGDRPALWVMGTPGSGGFDVTACPTPGGPTVHS